MSQYAIERVEDFDLNQSIPNDPAFNPQQQNTDRFPEMVVLADGDFLVLWRSPQNDALDPDRPPGTAFQRFNANGTLDGTAQNYEDVYYADVTALPDGGWILAGRDAWLRFDSTGAQVGSGVVADAGTQGSLVNVATLSDGGWVVAWSKSLGGGDRQLYTQTFSAAGVAGAVTPLGAGTADSGTIPMITGLPGGGFAATWVEEDGSAGRNIHISYNGVESVIDAQFEMGEPDIALLPDGRLLVAYRVTDNSLEPNIHAVFVATDGSVGTPFFAAGADSFDTAPRIAVFADGRFVLVWATGDLNDPFLLNLYGQVFEADGMPLDADDPFFIGGVPSESDYSVTALDATDFVVAWAPYGTTDRTLNGTRFSIEQGVDFVGTPGDDSFTGTIADDTAYGLGGNDSLTGLDGDDLLDGGEGADHLEGGKGDDTFYVDDAGDVVVEVADGGNDTVYTIVSYALSTFASVELLAVLDPASTAAINLTGSKLNQTIVGNAGANSIHGGGGFDVLQGLGGNDIYYADSAVTLVEALGGGFDQFYTSTTQSLAAGAEVEVLSANSHGATAAISLFGNEFAQTLVGNAGANTLDGRGGADVMIGFGGNDTYIVDNAGDQVHEAAGAGADTIFTSVTYTLGAGVHVENLSTVNQDATDAINLTGNTFNSTIIGNDGANQLHGGGGIDTLIGLGGNDIYYTDVAATQVFEASGGGNDQLYTSVSYVLGTGEVELLSANSHGATTAINLTGNGYSQTLVGNNGANQLHGGGGIDTLIGYGGNDIYYTDVAATKVFEAIGGGNDQLYTSVSYTLASGSEIELLSTNSHVATTAINLTGNGFNNTVFGNAGANVLDGKGGADTLIGLGGADTFAFTSALGGGNIDVIAGFSAADDTIALDDAIFTALGLGALNANAFVTGSAALDADDRIVYNISNGGLYYDADGSGGQAAVQFATLSGVPPLTAGDFIVI